MMDMLGLLVLMFPCTIGAISVSYKRTNQGLQQVPAYIPSDTLKIDLSYNEISVLRKTFIKFLHCTHLDLHCNHIEDIESGYFSSFISLETLRLDHNCVQNIRPEYFIEIQSIRMLSLGYNQISTIFKGSFVTQTKLKSLYLSGNSLTIISSDMLIGLKSLEYLYIGSNKIHKVNNCAFKYTKTLKHIHLRRNFLRNINRNMWLGLSNLEDLDLSSNEIISIEQEAFGEIKNLKMLSLAYNKLLSFEGYVAWSITVWTKIELHGNPMNFTEDFTEDFSEHFTEDFTVDSTEVLTVDFTKDFTEDFTEDSDLKLDQISCALIFITTTILMSWCVYRWYSQNLLPSTYPNRHATNIPKTLSTLSRAQVRGRPQYPKKRYDSAKKIGGHSVEFRKG